MSRPSQTFQMTSVCRTHHHHLHLHTTISTHTRTSSSTSNWDLSLIIPREFPWPWFLSDSRWRHVNSRQRVVARHYLDNDAFRYLVRVKVTLTLYHVLNFCTLTFRAPAQTSHCVCARGCGVLWRGVVSVSMWKREGRGREEGGREGEGKHIFLKNETGISKIVF